MNANPSSNAGDWTLKRAVWKVSQVARELACSERSVREWCETGALSSLKTGGGHHRIEQRALRAFLGLPPVASVSTAAPLARVA